MYFGNKIKFQNDYLIVIGLQTKVLPNSEF